ncbi:MAG: Hsp33 family molecular chaperone HslO [Spirochaetales bacterium]|uniref:Hsp33 family molecular chaperone HslO n=1 Tax=Candidatus Thalassospirochaeta sargassi TaxID=3119039 RepID=A0AAJ1ML86_9SPIO|nr:Hsp33 family molecular chaperone HslO [Spirochaetales bacterium]
MSNNESNMKIFLLNQGSYRGAALDATEMIRKMQTAHETGVLETYALGETYIAAGLLTSMLKGNDRLALVFECGGAIGGINVEVNSSGHVRGFLKNKPFPLEKAPEDFNLSMLFGPGFLSVIKYLENSKQPFTGQVMIEYGSIAKDLANYYTTSENLPTAFNLSVKFNKDGSVLGAGGVFIQKMPAEGGKAVESENDETAGKLQDAIISMPSIGLSIADGRDISGIISDTFNEFSPNVVGVRNIEFKCSCNHELFGNYLKGLKEDDKREIYENGPFPVRTLCHNCNSAYEFSKNELKELFNF